MENGAVYLKKGEGRSMKAGGPWVYDNEVERIEGEPLDGDVVSVHDYNGFCLGKGFLNRRSKLRVRMLTRNRNQEIDEAFLRTRVENAWEYRKTVMGTDASACRVLFSEADGFPGLVVDRFEDVLVAETLSVGMERLKPMIFLALLGVLAEDGIAIRGLYERNDASTRSLEGLAQTTGWFAGAAEDAACSLDPINPCQPEAAVFGPTTTQITENGVRYEVDFENGQKTGFFLDQKYNRRAVAQLAAGRRVLDCFTHTGSFALNAAHGGAEYVNAVDISELAVAQARKNAQLNELDGKMDFTAANVFDLLPQLEAAHDRTYDFIVLDPPAFTKSRKTIDSAARGYKEINYRAMKLLPRGGYLATCSCSHFMDTERFRRVVSYAAQDAGVQLRQIEERQQAPDHPILWGVPETDYLKFFLFQVV